MRNLISILIIIILAGCTDIKIYSENHIPPGKVFVKPFESKDLTTGPIVSNIIKAELKKYNLFAEKDKAAMILSGNAVFTGWGANSISFELISAQNKNTIFNGYCETALIPSATARELAKKIIKKLKKRLTEKSGAVIYPNK